MAIPSNRITNNTHYQTPNMSNVDPFAAPGAGSYSNTKASLYPEGYYHPISSFDIGRMLTSPFKSPNWIMNMVWMLVCFVFSMVVVGNLVANGYLAEVAKARSGGKSEEWPDFDINRIVDYLLRGLWPFLWNLIWTIPMMILVGVPAVATAGMANVLAENQQQTSAIIVGVVGGLITLGLTFIGILLMSASMLRSALANDFLKGADMAWVTSYASKMALTSIVVGLVYWLISMVYIAIGAMVFCVGLLAAYPLIFLMMGDAAAQLHDIFVFRGGKPAFDVTPSTDDVVSARVI
jgi:hypothetical protein